MRIAATLPARLHVPGAGRARARLRRRDLAGGAEARSDGRLPRPATRSARPASRRPSTVPARARRLGAAPRRLARAAAGRARAAPGGRSPGTRVRLTLDVGLQRAAERALREGIEIAHANEAWNADGGAIVAHRPARRRDPRDGLEPDLQAVDLRRPHRPEEAAAAARPRRSRSGANYPGLNRAIDGVYPPGSTFKPVIALAAMQDAPALAVRVHPVHAVADVRARRAPVQELEPVSRTRRWRCRRRSPQSCDTYFYDVGNRFYERGPERGHWTRMQDWARKFGFGAADRARHRRRGDRPAADARVAQAATFTTAIDRAWNPGDSIQLAIGQKDMTVTPLQMARFYALLANGGKLVTPHLVVGGRAARARRRAARAGAARSRRRRRSRSASTRPRSTSCATGLYAATHARTAPRRASSAASRSRSPARRARPRRSSTCPATRPAISRTSRGGAAGARTTARYVQRPKPPIVVCALIENGGHGGTAAAPAALKVFEQ